MNIPDPAVYASIPLIGGAIIWGARQLINEQNRRNATPVAIPDAEPTFIQLSARDWINIIDAIEKQFNGRYWLATEARKELQELRAHMDQHTERLHDRISAVSRQIDVNQELLVRQDVKH